MYVPAPSLNGRALVWVSRDGSEEPLSLEPQAFSDPRLSPRGDRIAVAVSDGDPARMDVAIRLQAPRAISSMTIANWQRFSEYRSFVFDSGIGDTVAELLGSSTVRFFHAHVLVKEPGTREISPWHQDQSYYCVDGEQVCSIWLPLDPVPQSVCPEFVAGSHLWNRMFTPLKFVDHRPYDCAFERFEDLPDIEAKRGDYEIVSWTLEPGDAIAFHMKTVHGALGTATHATRRRAIATRWLGDDAVFAERPVTTSRPFPGLDLEPGDPMEHELFPMVVSRS